MFERHIYHDGNAFEVRDDHGESPKIAGYAAIFNERTEILPGLLERVSPGAFAGVIADGDTRALFNHDANHVLGRLSAGTLKLAEDERGLLVEIDPPATPFVDGLLESIRRGDITGASFAFRVEKDSFEDLGDDVILRTIEQVKVLRDVGPVTFPAYESAELVVRSASEVLERGLVALAGTATPLYPSVATRRRRLEFPGI